MTTKYLKFKGVIKLHDKFFDSGLDVCKGCDFERNASCHKDRMKYCKIQLQKCIDNPEQMQRPCWWEKK